MKTAVSLPDELFVAAERAAKRMGKSRSELHREALAQYLARHDDGQVTAAMDRTLAQVGAARDGFTTSTARRSLERSEW
jgi:metal-responsive CopG/Arc/MetJ family transcriptional regulator